MFLDAPKMRLRLFLPKWALALDPESTNETNRLSNRKSSQSAPLPQLNQCQKQLDRRQKNLV